MNKNIRQTIIPMIVAIIWGSSFIAQGDVAGKMGAFTFNTVRSLIAVVTLFCVILIIGFIKKRRGEEYKTTNKKQLIVYGVICGIIQGIAANVQQFGMLGVTEAGGKVLTSGDAAFITALYVVLVPIGSSIFGKKIGLNVWIAVIVAIFGLVLVCNFTGGREFSVYHVLLFSAAFCFAAHILYIGRVSAKVDGLKLSCIQFLTAAILSGICTLIFEKVDFSVLFANVGQLLYVGVFSSGVAYTLQIFAQKDTNPTIVTLILCLESFFALITEYIVGFIGGTPAEHTPLQLLGCFIMLSALMMSQVNVFKKRENISS